MRFAVVTLFCTLSLYATEALLPQDLEQFLDPDNPFVRNIVSAQEVAEYGVQNAKSRYDTLLKASYHNKVYPASKGEYSDVGLSQSLLNGINFQAKWRQSLGTQEYNNIKTGKEGEMQVGINVDTSALVFDMNPNKFNLLNTKLEFEKKRYEKSANMQDIELRVMQAYYEVRYAKARLELTKELLERSKLREAYVLKRIEVGSAAELAHVEIQQQVINRKQRFMLAQTSYENALALLLQYLCIDKEFFKKRYHIEPMVVDLSMHDTLDELLQRAKDQRQDLKVLVTQEKQLRLQNKSIQSLAYPSLNVGAYGVHDFQYNEGYKVTFDMSFALQQNAFEAQNKTLQTKKLALDAKNNILLQKIKTTLNNKLSTLDTLSRTITLSQKEVGLLERLESAQEKKYRLGMSDLFMLNQREMATLEVKKKLLAYELQYQNIALSLKRDVADPIFPF